MHDEEMEKLYRIFRLIRMISQPPHYTVIQLAERLGVSKRTVYRDIDLLGKLGYSIDKLDNHRYFLQVLPDSGQEFFDAEEAGFVHDLLWQAPDNDPRRNRLLLKMNRQFELLPVVQSLSKFSQYEHIQSLGKAMEENKRVRLLNYLRSDGNIADRYVEPVEFQENYTYAWCYDLDKEDYRQYKVNRIGRVEVLDEPIEGKHGGRSLDVFGWSGEQWLPIVLELSDHAAMLLREEFPAVLPFLKSNKDAHLLDLPVKDWRGVGRFVLSLPGEIRVVESEAFREYLRGRVAGMLSSLGISEGN